MFVFPEDKSSCLLHPEEQQRGAPWAGDTCSTWPFLCARHPCKSLSSSAIPQALGVAMNFFSLVANMKIQLTKTPFEWDCRKPATS